MSTPAEIRNAASKVLAAHMDDIECIETIGALINACDSAIAHADQYRQIGHPEQRRKLPLNAADVAHDLAAILRIDLLAAGELIDDVLYAAKGEKL